MEGKRAGQVESEVDDEVGGVRLGMGEATFGRGFVGKTDYNRPERAETFATAQEHNTNSNSPSMASCTDGSSSLYSDGAWSARSADEAPLSVPPRQQHPRRFAGPDGSIHWNPFPEDVSHQKAVLPSSLAEAYDEYRPRSVLANDPYLRNNISHESLSSFGSDDAEVIDVEPGFAVNLTKSQEGRFENALFANIRSLSEESEAIQREIRDAEERGRQEGERGLAMKRSTSVEGGLGLMDWGGIRAGTGGALGTRVLGDNVEIGNDIQDLRQARNFTPVEPTGSRAAPTRYEYSTIPSSTNAELTPPQTPQISQQSQHSERAIGDIRNPTYSKSLTPTPGQLFPPPNAPRPKPWNRPSEATSSNDGSTFDGKPKKKKSMKNWFMKKIIGKGK